MSEPTLYRLDPDWTKRTAWAADTLAGLTDIGVLVPVERCEHGNIFRHVIESSIEHTSSGEWFDVCPGAGIGGDEDGIIWGPIETGGVTSGPFRVGDDDA